MDKNKISLKQTMEPAAAAKYLEDFLKGMQSGAVTLTQGEETLTMTLPKLVTVEVGAKVKKDSQKFSVELEWETQEARDDIFITGVDAPAGTGDSAAKAPCAACETGESVKKQGCDPAAKDKPAGAAKAK
jgi:amphi-Trp domain-containing protein